MHTDTSWQDLLYPGAAMDFFRRRSFKPFDPMNLAYCPGNALWLAELSRLVYRHDTEEKGPPPQPTRSQFLEQAGFRQRQFFHAQATGTQAMLVESVGSLPFAVLAFRGTEHDIQDYLTNLKFGQLALAVNQVHAGFAAALDSVWRDIAEAIDPLDCPIFYTGHSLGAALATLAAARRTPAAVYTFGSPRVGNAAFIASLGDVPIYRVVNDEDIVVTVPAEALGYRHAGTEIRLVAPSQQISTHHPFGPAKPLADHAPINYVDRI